MMLKSLSQTSFEYTFIIFFLFACVFIISLSRVCYIINNLVRPIIYGSS
jgi:hypothetical protein